MEENDRQQAIIQTLRDSLGNAYAVIEAYRTGQTMTPDYVQRTQDEIKALLEFTDPNKVDKS